MTRQRTPTDGSGDQSDEYSDLFETIEAKAREALLFLKDILKRCHGRPLVRADRGPWYDWPLELLDCECERETWGNRLLMEAWFRILKYRTRRFYHRFPFHSIASLARSWVTAFADFHNATL